MSELLDFTREEWADKPYVIELRGGYHDGKRHHWHDLPMIWEQPEPKESPIVIRDLGAEPLSPEPLNAWPRRPFAVYQRTGHVTDDGAHIYEFTRRYE